MTCPHAGAVRPGCKCPRECPCRDEKIGPCPKIITLEALPIGERVFKMDGDGYCRHFYNEGEE